MLRYGVTRGNTVGNLGNSRTDSRQCRYQATGHPHCGGLLSKIYCTIEGFNALSIFEIIVGKKLMYSAIKDVQSIIAIVLPTTYGKRTGELQRHGKPSVLRWAWSPR